MVSMPEPFPGLKKEIVAMDGPPTQVGPRSVPGHQPSLRETEQSMDAGDCSL